MLSTPVAPAPTGLDRATLDMLLESVRDFVTHALPESRQLELDRDDVCPEDLVRAMCGDELGIQLLFIPEEYGGHGRRQRSTSTGSARRWPGIDLGLATSVLATFLGSDPLFVGATAEQKRTLARRGSPSRASLFAYGATEPEAGSDLGALRTTATPVEEDGVVTGYTITGRKQWISNGGIADAYTILALRARRPVLVRRSSAAPTGFTQDKPEDKHGIRLSNTAALYLDDVVRACREPRRRRRGPGPRAGAAGLRLHAAHGRGVRARRRLVRARPGHRLLDRAQSRPARRCRRSRATRTS